MLRQAEASPTNTVSGPAFWGIGSCEGDLEAITGPFGVAGRQAGDGQERAALRTKPIKKQSSRLAFSFCCGYPCRRMNEGRGNERKVGVGGMQPHREVGARSKIGAAQIFDGKRLRRLAVFPDPG